MSVIHRSQPKHAKTNHHKLILKLIMVGICLILIFLGVVEWHHWKSTATSITSYKAGQLPKKLKDKRPFSVLVMGTDVGALGRGTSYAGNTDTMELMTVNPQKKKILMVAIPRDTLVKVQTNKGTKYVKINAAYAIGGPHQAKKQVSELLNVPVDYYALLNMGTLKKVVNAVGGVDVNNPFAFTYEGHHFKKGPQHLNGNEALKYSRMRYDDPNNDYGRQKRGQQVISSVIDSFKHHGSLTAANKIMDGIKDGVRTDVPVNNLASLYLNYRAAMNNVQRDHLQDKDATIEGVSFQIATPGELNRVSKEVATSLDLSPQKVNNSETAMDREQTTWDGYRNLEFRLPHHAHYNTYN